MRITPDPENASKVVPCSILERLSRGSDRLVHGVFRTPLSSIIGFVEQSVFTVISLMTGCRNNQEQILLLLVMCVVNNVVPFLFFLWNTFIVKKIACGQHGPKKFNHFFYSSHCDKQYSLTV